MLRIFVAATIILCFSKAITIVGEPDYTKILYGGVLPLDESEDSADENKHIIQFAVSFARRRYNLCEISEKEFKRVSTIRKLTLYFTYNEEVPYIVNNSGTLQAFNFGKLHTFSFQWSCGGNASIHNFTIATYPMGTHHVYSHTYVRVMKNDSYNVSLDSKYADSETKQQIEEPWCRETWIPSDMMLSLHSKSCRVNCTSSISVMTYNIWNTNTFTKDDKQYPDRFKLLEKVLLDELPDIITFQEVRYEHLKGGYLGPSQMKHLSDILKSYQFVYAPAQLDINSVYNGKTEEGVAVFSRFPVIKYNSFLLFRNRSNSADVNQRVCLHVQILHPEHGLVHILTTHLSLSHEAREESVVQIWRYIKGLRGPVLLTGDFNAEPQEKAMRFLRGEVPLKGERTCGVSDLWTNVYPLSPGFTFDCVSGDLVKRIDFIFWRNFPGNLQIKDIRIIQSKGKGSKAASDHLPVVAMFC